ncbi:MAG: GGDEF domain-containing protein [Shewanella sp.]|nr:GGDEF domain-containing protein [Shewanella sp.]MCF1429614.1 GGDEF domain-containing protein [Shewanella sp.]MCF1438355.1 GGDEF domain-containing protein [Shewanella sp.]MCF1458393.1 GGDEF domain-containing protein [Shewanella sp.]
MIHSFRNSAFRDPETGVYNQIYFLEVLNRNWHIHLRDQDQLTLVFLRPHLHETYHHPGLMESLTSEIQSCLLRANDIIARLDNDLFAIGLFNTSDHGTEIVVESVEQCMDLFVKNYERDHSFSLGYKIAAVGCCPTRNKSLETLFERTHQLSGELEHNANQHLISKF